MSRRARAVAITALGVLLVLAPAVPPAPAHAAAAARISVRVRVPQRAGAAAQAPLALAPPLASGTLGHRLRTYFSKPSTLVLLGVLVLCSLVLVVLRRRANRPRRSQGHRTADEQ
jgi:hypothetical protein